MSIKRPLKLTFFKSIYAKSKQDARLSLEELAEKIESTAAESKEQLPWVKLARFGDEKSDKGSLRNNHNMLSIDGVELDYDAGQIQPEEAHRRLRKAKLAHVVYTSASHTPEKPRFRVLVPTSKTLPVTERKQLVARVNGLLDGDVDGASFTDSQAYYFGKTNVNRNNYRVFANEGRAIDEAKDLDAAARGKRQRDGSNEEGDRDETGSGAAWRLAMEIVYDGGTLEDFEEAIADRGITWKDYERDPDYALTRTYARALMEKRKRGDGEREEVEFENLDEGEEEGADEPKKKATEEKSKPIVMVVDQWEWEELEDVPPLVTLYGGFLARGWLSATFSPGGVGKSALSVSEALSMASGVDFLGPRIERDFVDLDSEQDQEEPIHKFFDPLRVLLFNFEDDRDTLRRRFASAGRHHQLQSYRKIIRPNLFYSGAERQYNFSRSDKGHVIYDKRTWEAFNRLLDEIRPDVLTVDPFISTHLGSENDSGEIADVWGKWRSIASERQIAVHLVDHMRKGTPGQDMTVDDARGSGAKIGVARFSRVLNRMQPDLAEQLGLDNHRLYLRIDDAKANHLAPAEHAEWRKLHSVFAEGHEHSIVAVERWEYPEEAVEEAQEKKAAEGTPKQRYADLTIVVQDALVDMCRERGRKTFGKQQLGDLFDRLARERGTAQFSDNSVRGYITRNMMTGFVLNKDGPAYVLLTDRKSTDRAPGDDVL